MSFQYPVKLNAVSKAMYPEPMKSMAAVVSIVPIERKVPSSMNWKPTTAFRNRIHAVETTEAT